MERRWWRGVFSAGRDFLFLFIALGAVGAAGEFRHGTAVPTFLATPARWRVLVAKLAAHVGLGAIVAVACVAVEMAIALPWIDAQGTGVTPWSATVLEPAIGSILSGAAYCSLGVAVGTLVRNQIVALAVTLGWFAVAEAALATTRESFDVTGTLFPSLTHAYTITSGAITSVMHENVDGTGTKHFTVTETPDRVSSSTRTETATR